MCVRWCRVTEQLPPFYREIQSEEMWFYKFHRVEVDHVPTTLMFVSCFFSNECQQYKVMCIVVFLQGL